MAEEKKEMVEVELLKHGTGLGSVGDKVKVPAHVAEHMCKVRHVYDGQKMVEHRTAKVAGEKEAEPEMEGMSAGEAAALGIKNKVQTPVEDIGAVNEVAAEKAAAEAEEAEEVVEGGSEEAKPKKKQKGSK